MDDSKLTIHGTGYPLPCGYDAQLNILANQEIFYESYCDPARYPHSIRQQSEMG